MGFGHRIYKNYDPRAKIIKWTAEQVFEVTGRNPKLDIALELERIALEDEYFVKRKLYPNVDFYSGIMYQAMGFRPEMFTVLFAIPRTGLAGAVAGNDHRSGAEDRASAADLYGTRGEGIRSARQARPGADSCGISGTLKLRFGKEEGYSKSPCSSAGQFSFRGSASQLRFSGGVLGQLGQAFAMSIRRSDDSHLLPVIRKFLAAIQAGDISSG